LQQRVTHEPSVRRQPSGRVLILSASIGEGHDLPARLLAADIRAEAPGTEAPIVDGLAAMGRLLETLAMKGSPLFSPWGNRLFDLEYWLIADFAPTRAFARAALYAVGRRGLLRVIEAHQPDAVVSTYPGVTEVLGSLRQRGRLEVPVVSAITDLAALRYWSHPGVDLHLVTHPESIEEVRRIAGDTRVVSVRGFSSPDFTRPRERAEARRELELPADERIVVISGGGWAVGDLVGAVDATLALPGTLAVVLCGRNERVRASMRARFRSSGRVLVLAFTEHMSDLLAAADALVHSTAGLTVLEAHIRGCPAISYGWGRAHIRANNKAFIRDGLAEVATTRSQLEAALERALERRLEPDLSFAELPSAASAVLGLLNGGRESRDGDRGCQ
jgi:processive 1,2-diacylglycerol beta-glucosyltransferase